MGVGVLPININEEPRDEKYKKLIEYAFKVCKTFVLAMQKEMLLYYPKPEILKELEPYKVDEGKALYYPNIDYFNNDTIFYFYKCNEETQSIVMDAVNGLYEWRYPEFPEDITFLNDKGEVWMNTISHECMAGINENDINEIEFIRNEIGLDIYWIERVYTEEEALEAIHSLFRLIDEYFYLSSANIEGELDKEPAYKENSPYYGYWRDFYTEYEISENNLAFEIARFSNLLKLDKPIYAYDFLQLLDDKNDNRYLVKLLVKNINGNSKILYDFIAGFKMKYGREK
jgi:hypothetical protein